MMAMAGEPSGVPMITMTSETGNQIYTQSLLSAAPVPSVTVLQDDLGLCCDVTQLSTDHCASQTFSDGIYSFGGDGVQYLVLSKDGQLTQVPVLSAEGNQPVLSAEGNQTHTGDHTMEIAGNQSIEMMGNQQLTEENGGKRRDRLECGLCGELFEDVLKFLQHKSGHVGRGAGLGCEFCHLSFSRQLALTEHYRRKHKVVFEPTVHEAKPSKHKVLFQQTMHEAKPSKHKVIFESAVHEAKRIKVAKTHSHHSVKGRKSAANRTHTDAGGAGNKDSCARVNAGREVKSQSQLAVDSIINNTDKIDLDISEGTDSLKRITTNIERSDSVQDERSDCVQDKRSDSVQDETLEVVTDTVTTDVNHELKFDRLRENVTGECEPAFVTVYGIGSAGQLPDNVKQVQQVSLLTGNVSNTSVALIDGEKKPIIYSTENVDPKISHEQTTNILNSKEEINRGERLSADDGNISEILQMKKCDDEKKAVRHTNCNSHHMKTRSSRCTVTDTESLSKTAKEDCISLDGCAKDMIQHEAEVSCSEPATILKNTITKSTEIPVQVLCTDQESDMPSIAIEDRHNSEKENANDQLSKVSIKLEICGKEPSEKSSPVFENISKLVNNHKNFVKDLDMPDFHFILGVDHAPKRKTSRGGKCNFKCLYCDNKCSWRSTICRHMTEKHSDILKVGGLLMISPEDIELEPGQSVTKMSEYVAQERSCKRIRGVEKQDLPGDFPCEKCGKMFHRLRYLRKHLLLHKSEKNFLCSECVKSFKTIANLKQHMKTHREREMFKCSQCNFESNINKAIHVHRQIHSGGCVLCDICGRAYNDRSTLAKHMQVHDMARPYSCNFPGCTWRFKTMMMCHAHYRTHTTKGKFECGECGYVFRKKHHLYRHERKAHNIFTERRAYYRYTEPVAIEYNYVEDHTTVEKLSTIPQSGNSVKDVVDMATDGVNEETPCAGDSVTVEEQFDLECALQNGQLVIATDTGTAVNYEMSDIGMAGSGYQTLLHDGEGNQLDSATILIPQSDGSHILYQHEETIDSEDPA